MIVFTVGLTFRFTASLLSALGRNSLVINRPFRYFLPLTLPFSNASFPGVLFYCAFCYPSVCYIVILSCLLRKSICDFFSINSGISFHPFKFYFPVLFVQIYCFLPNFFNKMVVIFSAPYWVQSYLAVRVNDYCLVFVTVNLLRLYGFECFTIASFSAWLLEHL